MRLGQSLLMGVLCLSVLAGCAETRRTLGLERVPPDEFTVLSRAPLTLPPDYELRPPRPGAERPQEGSTRERARAALLGVRQNARSGARYAAQLEERGFSPGEIALLRKAGTDEADPGIRRTVNVEAETLVAAERDFTDRMLFWRTPADPTVQALDPVQEAMRIRASAGRTAERPPSIRRDTGVF